MSIKLQFWAISERSTQIAIEDMLALSQALRRSMDYVNPAHKAALAEMARIEAAASDMAPVNQILRVKHSALMRDIHRCYKQITKQVYPHLGGNFVKPTAERAMVIVARSW